VQMVKVADVLAHVYLKRFSRVVVLLCCWVVHQLCV